MRYLLLAVLLINTAMQAQDLHQEVIGDDEKPFLLGPIQTEMLQKSPYGSWFDENYSTYQADASITKELKESLRSYRVLVFLGTWCGDSRREVPRFFKILDEVAFPREKLKVVAVDRRKPNVKKSPTGEEWGLQIKRVPTFIFLKDGKEVNRIVEYPVNTLESDMLTITRQKEYEPHYAELMKTE